MNNVGLNVAIVIGLILIEAVFVAAEIALVSLREGQVRAIAESGRRGQAVAKLVADPNRFLAAVQIGVTSTALLSSAFGAVTLSEQAKDFLLDHGWSKGFAAATGIIGVTLAISFVTLVVGELAPKRLGLQRAEAVSRLLGPPLHRMAVLCRPIIWLLSRCTDVLVRLFGGDPNTGREAITQAELRDLVSVHESLTKDERRLIDEVFGAGERSISEVMVPRTEVTFLEATQSVTDAAELAVDAAHSRFPVVGESQDDVRGFVHIRDLLVSKGNGRGGAGDGKIVGDVVREVKRLPGSKNVLVALSEMRREGHQMAIVVDEYGGTDGIITLEDLVEEVIGDIRDEYDDVEAGPKRLLGGVVEIDGRDNLDEVESATGLALPEGPYETVAGFVMSELGRLPAAGDVVNYDGYALTVIDVDGRRAARVRVSPPVSPSATSVE